jgi:hypothetical protein
MRNPHRIGLGWVLGKIQAWSFIRGAHSVPFGALFTLHRSSFLCLADATPAAQPLDFFYSREGNEKANKRANRKAHRKANRKAPRTRIKTARKPTAVCLNAVAVCRFQQRH